MWISLSDTFNHSPRSTGVHSSASIIWLMVWAEEEVKKLPVNLGTLSGQRTQRIKIANQTWLGNPWTKWRYSWYSWENHLEMRDPLPCLIPKECSLSSIMLLDLLGCNIWDLFLTNIDAQTSSNLLGTEQSDGHCRINESRQCQKVARHGLGRLHFPHKSQSFP